MKYSDSPTFTKKSLRNGKIPSLRTDGDFHMKLWDGRNVQLGCYKFIFHPVSNGLQTSSNANHKWRTLYSCSMDDTGWKWCMYQIDYGTRYEERHRQRNLLADTFLMKWTRYKTINQDWLLDTLRCYLYLTKCTYVQPRIILENRIMCFKAFKNRWNGVYRTMEITCVPLMYITTSK